MKRHPIGAAALALISSLAIAVGLGELLVRSAPKYFGQAMTFSQVSNSYLVTVNGKEYNTWPFWIPSETYAFSLKKNAHFTVVPRSGDHEFAINTNRLGFRFAEELLAEQSKKKVMVLGDSVTFGHGVNDDETIAQYLNRGFHNASFINFGVGAWSFGEYYLTYKMFRDKVSPELVVLITYTGNDFYELDRTSWEGRESGGLPQIPLQRLDYSFDSSGNLVGTSLAYKYPILRDSALWVALDKNLFSRVREEVIRSKVAKYKSSSADTAIAMMLDIARQSKLLVVVVPYYGEVGKNAQFLKTLSKNPSISVLDASPIVREMSRPEQSRKYYLSDGVHFTAEGNKRMAEEIRQYIVRSGLAGLQ